MDSTDVVAAFDNIPDKARLIEFREHYRVSNNLAKSCRETGVPENTARKWAKRGLLNFDNMELQEMSVLAVGPEKIEAIIRKASENLFRAQERVAMTIEEATARDASRIAVEQFNIMRVAEGQATTITEFRTGEDVANLLNKLLRTEEIEGDAVEIIDA